MANQNMGTISILTPVVEELDTYSAFPTTNRLIHKSTEIAAELFGDNLQHFLETLGQALQRLPDSTGGYDLETLTIAISISATGKISLIGEVGAGSSSTVTLTLRRPRPSK